MINSFDDRHTISFALYIRVSHSYTDNEITVKRNPFSNTVFHWDTLVMYGLIVSEFKSCQTFWNSQNLLSTYWFNFKRPLYRHVLLYTEHWAIEINFFVKLNCSVGTRNNMHILVSFSSYSATSYNVKHFFFSKIIVF